MDNKLGVCEYCSSEFVKKYKSQRFCCRECSTKSRTKNDNKKCEWCGKIFKGKWKGQKYCSHKCNGLAHRRENKICPECLQEYQPTYYNQTYCCRECADKHRTVNKNKICPICGIEFLGHSKNQICCSTQCAGKYRIKYDEIQCPICLAYFHPSTGDNKYCSKKCGGIARRTLTEKKCPICGKLFYPHAATVIYCSQECGYVGQSIKQKEIWKNMSKEDKEKKMESLHNSCDTENSGPNKYYREKLSSLGFDVLKEFKLGGYSYDIRIGDILIEINEYPYHNSTRAPPLSGAKPKSPEYHYNKTKCAIANGYNIINVWNWTPFEELIDLLQSDIKTTQGHYVLHWYNPKTKDHVIDSHFNKQEMIDKGYLEIYDGGEKYIKIETKLKSASDLFNSTKL